MSTEPIPFPSREKRLVDHLSEKQLVDLLRLNRQDRERYLLDALPPFLVIKEVATHNIDKITHRETILEALASKAIERVEREQEQPQCDVALTPTGAGPGHPPLRVLDPQPAMAAEAFDPAKFVPKAQQDIPAFPFDDHLKSQAKAQHTYDSKSTGGGAFIIVRDKETRPQVLTEYGNWRDSEPEQPSKGEAALVFSEFQAEPVLRALRSA